MSEPREVRVVVIDDSAYNRQTLTAMLESAPGVRVVARAGDGDEGLRMVFAHQPDVITLDLEMPKMDGYTFLRLLMAKRPTPVIVVSSNGRRESIFKALELGALDFVTKPTARISPELRDIHDELVRKVGYCARLRPVSLSEHLPRRRDSLAPGQLDPAPAPVAQSKFRLLVLGASTGGPPALMTIAQALPRPVDLNLGILVGLHMPTKFTAAFADRLARSSHWPFREAKNGDVIGPGVALVAPGGSITSVVRDDAGGLKIKIDAPEAHDVFMPSIDRLFESAAASGVGDSLLAVVLTGMGGDGARGVKAVRDAGGKVIAESAETAVIFGMPEEAIKTGAVSEVLPLPQIAQLLARFASGGKA